MRVLVISDSHGNASLLREVLAKEANAAVVIHLGDGAREAALAAANDNREWHIVCGNCDIGSDAPSKKIITLGGKRLYLTHGHAERVKSGMLTLCYTAREHEAAAALYGHTHIPMIRFDSGVLLLNPGSLAYTHTYGVLEIDKGNLLPAVCELYG